MRKLAISLSTLAVTAMTLTACGGSSGGPSAKGDLVDGKTFTMAVSTDPGTLDPMLTVLTVARNVDRFLYGRLVEQQDDGSVIPAIAEKWEATTTEATFTLREGVTCSDGSPVTATDVAANVNFAGDPANRSPLLGTQVMPGTTATGDDDARLVTVKSGAPDSFLLLNIGSLPIACGKGLTNRDLLAKGESGTGMFTISEAVANDHYTLTRRDDYTWGPGDWDPDQKGLPDKVVIKVVPNESTTANLLLSGDVNAGVVVGPDQDRLTAQKLFRDDLLSPMGQLFFNQKEGRATAEEDVRRALVQALDLDAVGKVLTSGKGKAATGLVTIAPDPCREDTVDGNLPSFDVDAANSALDAAGWKTSADGTRAKDGKKLALTIVYPTALGETESAAAELIQLSWKEIGVDAKLKGVDSTAFNEVLFKTGDWDVSMGPFAIGLPSQMVPFVSGATPSEGTNFAHVDNADYEAAVKKATSAAGAEGCADWTAAEVALFESVDVVSYIDSAVPYFGNGAEFAVNDGLDPASIRMYE